MYTTLISAADLAAQLTQKDWVIVDCQFNLDDPGAGQIAYAAGHLPGACYAHLDADLSGATTDASGRFLGRHPLPDRETFAEKLRAWGVSDSTQIVAYDAQGSMYAARLWWLARWMGHDAVAVLDGGLPTWQAAQLQLSQQVPDVHRGNFSPKPTQMTTVTREAVLANIATRAKTVVDARAPERFCGEVANFDARVGHIPGAKNRFFRDNLNEHGQFKSAATLREAFGALFDRPEAAIMQCGSGVTACHNLLALEVAGLSGAALYPGSWSEWSSDPDYPVAC